MSARSADATLGEITLRAHQREAVARVHARIDQYGGCLLADDVGRGKTYVALAVARRWCRPLAIVPAALCGTWQQAMRRAGVSCPLFTHEALSRGGVPGFVPDGIIVDESHHYRNLATRRHAALADLCVRSELLLLSATPLQNATWDLAAQLSLFLGSAALRASMSWLAAHVVRVDSADADARLPVLAPPRWVPVHADDADVLRAILELPPPPRALDAGDAGALRTLSLVRAWASSRAALLATLARRRREATGIEQSVEALRVPTRAELRSWRGADDGSQQLGFASLLVARGVEGDELRALHKAVLAEHAALGRLTHLLRTRPDPDDARAGALVALADAHRGARVLAFTGLASTARAYYARLRSHPRVGVLTAGEARIASGRVTRAELLARFAPVAQGLAEPPPRERIALLISTDLLAEGMNLQDASVVVHLDLPWNPARMAQRVGRTRRPAGANEVFSYLIAPPADAELLLQVEARLRRKLADSQRAIGRGIDVVPRLTLAGVEHAHRAEAGLADARAALHRRIARWRRSDHVPHADGALVAAASDEVSGWLALLGDGRLVAHVDGDVGEDVALLERAARAAEGSCRPLGDGEEARARHSLASHLRSARVLADCGATVPASALSRSVERRAATLLGALPRHQRALYLPRIAALRDALTRPIPLGAERSLSRVLASRTDLASGQWLDEVLALVQRVPASGCGSIASDELRALVVFGPASPRCGSSATTG